MNLFKLCGFDSRQILEMKHELLSLGYCWNENGELVKPYSIKKPAPIGATHWAKGNESTLTNDSFLKVDEQGNWHEWFELDNRWIDIDERSIGNYLSIHCLADLERNQ